MSEGKPRGRPPNDPASTRAKLIEAAADLFNREGYFGTDSNKIAKAAGFAPATFYRHFKDKKQIFLEAYAQWVNADWAIIEAAIHSRPTPEKMARNIVSAHIAHHEEWVGFRRSMHGLVATDSEARDFHLEIRAQQLKRLEHLLAELDAPKHAPGDLLYSFLAIERASNAVTDGDLEALGISRDRVIARIEKEIVYLLTGKRHAAP